MFYIYSTKTKTTPILTLLFTLLFCASAFAGKLAQPLLEKEKEKQALKDKAIRLLQGRPVEFIENKGQMRDMKQNPVPFVLFKAEAPGVDVFVTEKGLTYLFTEMEEIEDEKGVKEVDKFGQELKITCKYERMNMNLLGATIRRENIVKEEPSLAVWNYLAGTQASQSVYDVHKYKKITIKNVYPGIDWVLYNSSKSGFKYDFVVHGSANVNLIQMQYESGNAALLQKDGSLQVSLFNGMIKEEAPYSYLSDSKQKVNSAFKVVSQGKKNGYWQKTIGVSVDAKRSNSENLIIDPQLVWSTYFGGTNFEGTFCADTDPAGNLYMCGYGASTDFPFLNPGAAYFYTLTTSCFIVKFSNSGALMWSTSLAGTNTSYLATDASGNLFVCGTSASTLFPVFNNNTYFQAASAGSNDACIVKFNSTGAITWATFYGGSNAEQVSSVATDPLGNVYLLGTTTSTNFPVQNAGGYFEGTITTANTGYIVKFDNSGTRLWASYLKGIQLPIAATSNNNDVYIAARTSFTQTAQLPLFNPGGGAYYQGTATNNSEAFLLKFDSGTNQAWGTFYGGSSNDAATSCATDKYGNFFVTGTTNSTNFPLQNAGTFFQNQLNLSATSPTTGFNPSDIFVLKFNSACNRQWATYLGGSRNDNHMEYDNLTIDTCGNVFVAFTTTSRNPPLQQACDGGMYDSDIDTSVSTNYQNVYLSRFSNSGNLMWSSYFGGDGNSFRTALDADRFGNVFFSGEWTVATNTLTYPLVNPGGSSYFSGFVGYDDMYIAKFTNNPPAQSFSYTGGYCGSDTAQAISVPPGFVTGGSFSSAPGLSINPVSGKVYPSASTPGTYTVSYSLPICYCPGATQSSTGSATLSILPAPLVSILGNTTLCVGQKMTYTATGANTYNWSNGSTTPTLNITPSTTTSLSYTVTGQSGSNTLCVSRSVLNISVSKCTGVEEAAMGASLVKIFPNPNKGEFTVSADRDMHLILSNELGQLVKEIHLVQSASNQVKLTGLAPGLYFLTDKSNHSAPAVKIIVAE